MYVRPPADELMHYGVKGMKWGVRRALKKQAKYADRAERMSKAHKSASRVYSETANKLRNTSDKEYAKQFDDKEYLRSLGGARKARLSEIQYNEIKAGNSARAGKAWAAAHDEIMNTPIDRIKRNRDYREIINRHLLND